MFSVVATVFAVVGAAELPDKTAIACLVLGARYRPLPVLTGVATAFAVHVAVAVTLGGFVSTLPKRPIDTVTSMLFLAGAGILLRSDPQAAAHEGAANAARLTGPRNQVRVASGAFGVVLVAEFGDLTQILTATLAARYGDPWSVGAGALLALWSVATLAVLFGRRLLDVVPLRRVQQAAAAVLAVLAVRSLVEALSG